MTIETSDIQAQSGEMTKDLRAGAAVHVVKLIVKGARVLRNPGADAIAAVLCVRTGMNGYELVN